MDSHPAVVTIGIPVYRGEETIAETLRSIRDQAFERYQVLISIDGDDITSMAACEPFLSDPRISIFTQEKRLGWARNLNWLMKQCRSRYFCYWQQDDLADTSYLKRLVAHGRQHPEAVCLYADVQWFGAAIERSELPSVVGPALDRGLRALTAPAWVAFRGLVRTSALRKVGPLRTTHRESSNEGKVWIIKLAGIGELHRVPGTLYFKRAHKAAATASWRQWPAATRRSSWLAHGAGLLSVLLPLAEADQRRMVFEAVIDQLIGPRAHFYDASEEPDEFIGDLVREIARARELAPSVFEQCMADFREVRPDESQTIRSCRAGFEAVADQHRGSAAPPARMADRSSSPG